MVLLGHEGRVRGMVRREQEGAVGQPLEAVHVGECAAQRQRRKGENDE
jgi:hypothetical protein